MTENKLEGFEDFDNLLGEAEGEGGGGEIGGELDDLLGGEPGGGGEGGEGMGEGGGDSELDSFFEDLSTIDDLEVLQEDEGGEEEAPMPDEGEDTDIEVGAPEPVAAAERAPEPERKPKKEKKKRTGPGFIRRWGKRLILLAILVGGGYAAYTYLLPEIPPPWETIEEGKVLFEEGKGKVMKLIDEALKGEAPPPLPKLPEARMEPPLPKPPKLEPLRPTVRKPAPRVVKPRPPREHGPWSIQVATCFFPSCLEGYQSYLKANNRSVLVRQKTSQSQSLEIYSVSTFGSREDAQNLVDRINLAHPLEGHAYFYRENGSFRISMGKFEDLARAKLVKENLNRQFVGEIVFATRAKAFPYRVKSVLTGRYPTRARANAALAKLRNDEPRFKDAFVVRN